MANTVSLQPVKEGHTMAFSNHETGAFMELWEDNDNPQTWARGFKIWFNGRLVDCLKTFKAFEKNVNKRISENQLQRDHKAEKELNE